MPIPFSLQENTLTTDPDDYYAIVQPIASADLDLIAQRMVENGSVLSKGDILALLEQMITACESLLLEGYRVNIGGLVELFARVAGVFDGAAASFNPAIHRILAGANAGSRIAKTLASQGSAQQVEAVKPKPNPIEYRDIFTAESNGSVTPGKIGSAIGHRLKSNLLNVLEGIFFVPVAGGAAIRVDPEDIQRNKPGELVWLNPALPAGQYRLEVRATYANEIRAGELGKILTV